MTMIGRALRLLGKGIAYAIALALAAAFLIVMLFVFWTGGGGLVDL